MLLGPKHWHGPLLCYREQGDEHSLGTDTLWGVREIRGLLAEGPWDACGQGMTEPEKVINLSLGVQRVPGAELGQSEHPYSNYTAIISSDEGRALWSVLAIQAQLAECSPLA